MSSPIQVVAGLIQDDQGRLLACQRPAGKHLAGKWEFPGGKLENGESPAVALIRELQEELGITVQPGETLSPVIHNYGRGEIELIPILCTIETGELEAREHSALRWCNHHQLKALDLAEADLPILHEWANRGA